MSFTRQTFPSPSRGLFFYCRLIAREPIRCVRFPSPARGLFFYWFILLATFIKILIVSVPCLGLFFIDAGRWFSEERQLIRFRPLFGAYFFINKKPFQASNILFPSPIRGLFFHAIHERDGNCCIVFPSPTWGLFFKWYLLRRKQRIFIVSVPYLRLIF